MSAPTLPRLFVVLLAAAAFCPWANAQSRPQNLPNPADCPVAGAMKASQLFGRWAVQYSNPPPGLPATATVVLQRHAEFSDSLAGTVTRPAPIAQPEAQAPSSTQAALAGDLDGALLLLDESSDKIRLTASWNGEMVPGSCGTAFAGQWKDLSANTDNTADVRFTLTRLP